MRDDRERPKFPIGRCLELARAIPDPVYVANPLFTSGQLGTLTALPNHGKTTFMVSLMVAMAMERTFGPILPAMRGLFYIVSAEDVPGTRNRLFAEADRHEFSPDELRALDGRLRWAHVDEFATAPEIVDMIATDADGFDVALVFIDTGPALFGGTDENDNIALRDFVASFRQMKSLPGAPCTTLSWHPTKGATEDRLHPRGASSIGGSTDFNLTLWREDDDRIKVSYTKLRALTFEPLTGKLEVRLIDPPKGASVLSPFTAPIIVMDAGDKPEREGAVRQAREAIITAMLRAGGQHPVVRDLAQASGIPTTTAFRHLKAMAGARPPLVEKDAVSDQYKLTKAGAARAEALVDNAAGAYRNARDPG